MQPIRLPKGFRNKRDIAARQKASQRRAARRGAAEKLSARRLRQAWREEDSDAR